MATGGGWRGSVAAGVCARRVRGEPGWNGGPFSKHCCVFQVLRGAENPRQEHPGEPTWSCCASEALGVPTPQPW